MRIRPVFDRIVVRQLKPSERTSGGIVIPGNVKEEIFRGKVVAVGPGRLLENGTRLQPEVNVGDVVTFGTRVRGAFIKDLDEEYLIMQEGDVLAIIEEGETEPGRVDINTLN